MVNSQVSFDNKLRNRLVFFAFILFLSFVTGIYAFLTQYSYQEAGFALSYTAGLSMIFLPCTLPLAFIVVPIALNENPRKALKMTFLFGAGMAITSSIYGIAFIYSGQTTGLLTSNVYAGILGGGLAYIFGLSGLGIIKLKLHGFMPGLPDFIQKRRDNFKIFLLGLLLSNVGLDCPNPVFYDLAAHIIGTADVLTGWSIMAVYGLGRAIPLIFLALLGTLGIDLIQGIKKRIFSVKKATDWGLILSGAVLFTISGVFTSWYDDSAFHEGWNNMLIELSNGKIGEVKDLNPETYALLETIPQWLGPYIFVLLLALPVVLHFYKNRGKIEAV